MAETIDYIHLAPRERSGYQQYFVKGRSLRAETLFRATVGPEPMTPDEVAQLRRAGRGCPGGHTLLPSQCGAPAEGTRGGLG